MDATDQNNRVKIKVASLFLIINSMKSNTFISDRNNFRRTFPTYGQKSHPRNLFFVCLNKNQQLPNQGDLTTIILKRRLKANQLFPSVCPIMCDPVS